IHFADTPRAELPPEAIPIGDDEARERIRGELRERRAIVRAEARTGLVSRATRGTRQWQHARGHHARRVIGEACGVVGSHWSPGYNAYTIPARSPFSDRAIGGSLNVVLLLAAAAAGGLLAVQVAANSALGQHLGKAAGATLVSFLVGSAALVLYML